MNKKTDSPFSKVTSFIANKNGDNFSFNATDEAELLLSTDVLSQAIALERMEGKTPKGRKFIRNSIRPIIGISGNSYWTLELIRRHISNTDNKFISISKVVDLHMKCFWLGDSDLDEFTIKEGIESKELTEAYNSLRRLLYVKADDGERMMEFRVPELTNSAVPIWRSAMLNLFAPSLLTREEFEELLSLLSIYDPLELNGGNFSEALHYRLINERIDFHEVNKELLKKRKLLIKEWEKENKIDYDPRKIRRPRFDEQYKEIRKHDQYASIDKAEIDIFNHRFKHLQEIAKKQGTLVTK